MPTGTWGTAPVFMYENGEYYFYHNDHLGTPMKMTDEQGNVVWSAVYGSFGEAIVEPTSTVANNLRFPGQYYDQETGKHYNWHRYYDYRTGRYTQEDPIGFAGGDTNLFGYVKNRPTKFRDQRGLYDEPGGSGGTDAPVSPPNPSAYPLDPANWQPNPNGIVCGLVCGAGKTLMCWALGAGAGAATGGTGSAVYYPCQIATSLACKKICPPPFKPKCP